MPSITLESFKANLKDVARPNRFLVTLTPPPGIFGAASNEEMTYMVKAASLPGRNIGEVPLSWQGQIAKLAGDPTFDNWDVTFLADYDMKARRTMEEWVRFIANQFTNERTIQQDYKAEFIVKQIGRTQNEVLATYKFYGIFPTVVAAIDLASDSTDVPGEFTVTFSYDYYEMIR